MPGKDRVFLDTNVLIYLASEDSPFHSSTLAKIEEVAFGAEIWISR